MRELVIAIAFNNVAVVTIIDALEELVKGDELSTIVAPDVLVDISSGLWWSNKMPWSMSSVFAIRKDY